MFKTILFFLTLLVTVSPLMADASDAEAAAAAAKRAERMSKHGANSPTSEQEVLKVDPAKRW